MAACQRVIALGGTIGLLACILAGAGCDAIDLAPFVSATSTINEEFRTTASPRVVVDTFNGSIDVSNSDSNEVVVEVVKRAGGINQEAAEANLDLVEVSIVEKDDTITITAARLGRAANCGASVVVAVPKAARLDLHSSNGYILTEDLTGPLEARTSNGKITVVEGAGHLELETSNGAIDVEAQRAQVQAKTSNGSITFRGTLVDDDNRFRTSNGRIRLYLPQDSQFEFEGSTSNARVECEFPFAEQKRASKRKLAGRVGRHPTARIVAQSSNGSIRVEPFDADED